ncbi:UNVERIFIED_CONTAM: acetyl-CoA carboxylase alpha subunit [Brevibacillus sp. OAP136]
MAGELPFEKPLIELQDKIKELRRFTEEKGIDFSDEVARLEIKAKEMAEQIYGQLTPWQRVQLSRHPQRPTTLDYINHIFTDFIEFHGDRLFGDDMAIVGGIAYLDGRPITVIGHQKRKRHERKHRAQLCQPASGRVSEGIAPDAASQQI